jgi:putative membrane protein
MESEPHEPAPIGYERSQAALEGTLHPLTIVVAIAQTIVRLLPIIAFALLFRIAGRPADKIEIILGLIGSLRGVFAIVVWLTFRYRIEEGVLHIRQGILFHTRRTIPLQRIQNINIKRDWIHQFLGVAEVQVETAGGSGAEASLSSLTLADAQTLRTALLSGRDETASLDAAEQAGGQVVYAASVGRLILAGATRNQAGTVIAAILGGLYYVGEILGGRRGRRVFGWFSRFLPRNTPALAIAAVGIAAVVLLGWIVSMARSVITYYNFRLERHGKRLRRSFGLFTKRENMFPAHRLQVLRVEAPMIQRKLGLCRVIAYTAGSFVESEEAASSELCPIIERRRVGEVCSLVLEDFDLATVPWRKVSRLTIRRAAVRYLLIVLAVTGLATLKSWLGLFALAAAPLALVASLLRYRALRWAVTEKLVVVRFGVWTRVIGVIPRDKIQHTALTSTPLQRRLKLASLVIRTAGGGTGGSGVRIVDLSLDVATQLQDELVKASAVGVLPA